MDCSERRHVHVQRERRVCKFRLDPVALADNQGFTTVDVRAIANVVREQRRSNSRGLE
ncbi:MAG: DUF4160 domain-containing protein [Casimicrobiaceae bacterium]